MRFTIPYADANPARITQGFHSEHIGLDMISRVTPWGQGVPLVAPERVKIVALSGDNYTPKNDWPLTKGFGVIMQGLESYNFHLYWHTGPVFPVKVGDIVERGKIVAYMSNSGRVYSGGKYVPIADRYTNKGTHLHWECFAKFEDGRKTGHMDPSQFIDWTLKPTYTLAEQVGAIAKTVLRLSHLMSK